MKWKTGELEEVPLPAWFMDCTNYGCGVVVYDPRKDITLSCPGCDTIGKRIDGK